VEDQPKQLKRPRRGAAAAGAFADAVGSAAERVGRALPEMADAARAAAGEASDAATWAVDSARSLARSAGSHYVGRGALLRVRNRIPLPSLQALHPEAGGLPVRNFGVREVPVAKIVGTAVEGADQRGSDFLPLSAFRSRNWSARWARIQAAVERLDPLPPIDVMAYDGTYWVVDGHNRVAAALYAGQVAIDAAVSELVIAGVPSSGPIVSLAAEMDAGAVIRSAVSGHPASPTLASGRLDRSSSMERTEVDEPGDAPDDTPDDTPDEMPDGPAGEGPAS
jgi:hypothetical protein